MRRLFVAFLFLTSCAFHPLYQKQDLKNVCLEPIPDHTGYQLYQSLKQHFSSSGNCAYTLKVQTPTYSFSDQSVSDKDFITMQRIGASTSYSLLNAKKDVVLSNKASTTASSAIVQNPYASVVAEEKNTANLNTVLADQIALHIVAFLDGQKQ